MERYLTLVFGATGYLGLSFVDYLLKNTKEKDISDHYIFFGHNPDGVRKFREQNNLPVTPIDLTDYLALEKLFSKNKILRIINLSGFISRGNVQNNSLLASIDANLIGSYNLIKVSKKFGINNLINIGSFRSISPTDIYGYTKHLSEALTLEKDYTVVTGPNFFGSKNSVIEVWYNQFRQKQPLTITDKSCVRYFVQTEDFIKLILSSFDRKGKIFPEVVFRIRLEELLKTFMEVFQYHNYVEIGLQPGEKIEENSLFTSKIVTPNRVFIKTQMNVWKDNIRGVD